MNSNNNNDVQSYWACFGLYPSSFMWKTKNTTTFRRLDMSPSSGGWGQIQSPKRCGIFLSSTYKTMDKVQNKPNSSVQHKPSSESFQV
jgi:ABC-type molybdate transport system substrate-binding protein